MITVAPGPSSVDRESALIMHRVATVSAWKGKKSKRPPRRRGY